MTKNFISDLIALHGLSFEDDKIDKENRDPSLDEDHNDFPLQNVVALTDLPTDRNSVLLEEIDLENMRLKSLRNHEDMIEDLIISLSGMKSFEEDEENKDPRANQLVMSKEEFSTSNPSEIKQKNTFYSQTDSSSFVYTTAGLVRSAMANSRIGAIATFASQSVSTKEPFVSADWLHANLKEPDVKVLDASWYMPDEQRNPIQEYQVAHIPGALFFDVDGIFDRARNLRHMLPSEEAFAAAVSALGIENKDGVIVYDGKGIFSAVRVWWMFRVFGHDRVWVLDGGLPLWRASGFDVESSAPGDAILNVSAASEAIEKVYSAETVKYPASPSGTTLVLLVIDDGIIVAADSLSSFYTGHFPNPIFHKHNTKEKKIKRLGRDLIYAGAGVISEIKLWLKPLRRKIQGTMDVLDAAKELTKINGERAIKERYDCDLFLVGRSEGKCKAFYVNACCHSEVIDKYFVGSGGHFAYMSMRDKYKKEIPTLDAINLAIQAVYDASLFDRHTVGSIDVCIFSSKIPKGKELTNVKIEKGKRIPHINNIEELMPPRKKEEEKQKGRVAAQLSRNMIIFS